MLGHNERIILGCNDGELFESTLVANDGIILLLDEGTDLDYLHGSFDGSNKRIPVGLLLVEAIGSDDRSMLSCSYGALEETKDGMLEE